MRLVDEEAWFVRSRIVGVAAGPGPLGLQLEAYGRDLTPRSFPRLIITHLFPLEGNAAPTVGALARLIGIGRPLRVESNGTVLYRDPGRSYGLERIYEPRDRRRRQINFAAWGIAEEDTALLVAASGPPSPLADEDDYELAWWGVREYEGLAWRPVASWHRGDPPEGRPYALSRRW